MSSVKICSLNCRGLRNLQKRRDVFNFLREKKASIYCLQDTHLLNSDDASVHTQWGFDSILCQGKNDARGVMNLFLNNFEYKLLRTKKDDKGNLLVVEIEVCNKM